MKNEESLNIGICSICLIQRVKKLCKRPWREKNIFKEMFEEF